MLSFVSLCIKSDYDGAEAAAVGGTAAATGFRAKMITGLLAWYCIVVMPCARLTSLDSLYACNRECSSDEQ